MRTYWTFEDITKSGEATEDQKYYSVSASDKSATAEIKRRTIELYDQLPMDEEGRKARLDIRDQVIELNYNFFGFVASHMRTKFKAACRTSWNVGGGSGGQFDTGQIFRSQFSLSLGWGR